MLFVEDDDSIMLTPLPGELFESEGSKDLLVRFLGGFLRRVEAKRFGLLLNAWMLKGHSTNKADAEAEFGEWRGHFHTHPNRVEVLNLLIADTQEAQVWMAEINRDETEPPTLDEWQQAGSAEGRFMELAEVLQDDTDE